MTAEVVRLEAVLLSDVAADSLREVDEALDDDRPVMAAELIRNVVAPAMARQMARIEEVAAASAAGRQFRERAIRVQRERRHTLEEYGAVLARGVGGIDDDQLVAALHAYGESERSYLALLEELTSLVPIGQAGQSAAAQSGSAQSASAASAERLGSASAETGERGSADEFAAEESGFETEPRLEAETPEADETELEARGSEESGAEVEGGSGSATVGAERSN